MDLSNISKVNPEMLDNEAISYLLPHLDNLISWAKAVQDYALDQAVRFGIKYKGYKVVEGRSVRRISDEQVAADQLISSGVEEAMLYERKFVTLTTLEKILGAGKVKEVIGSLIQKPPGKPALVPETDPRQAFSSAAQDFRD